MRFHKNLSLLFSFSIISISTGSIPAWGQTFSVPLNNQMIAMYSAPTVQAVPGNTWTVLNFDGLEVDTNSTVTTGTSWTFTSPENAYWDVRTCVLWSSITPFSGGYIALAVFKNGQFLKDISRQYEFYPLGYPINQETAGSVLVRCQQGDTIDIRAFHNAAQARNTYAGRMWVSISRIR